MSEWTTAPRASEDAKWTPLGFRIQFPGVSGKASDDVEVVDLERMCVGETESFLGAHGLAWHTLAVAAWSLLLARANREERVVVPVIETGAPFAKTLTLSVPRDAALAPWLSQVAAELARAPADVELGSVDPAGGLESVLVLSSAKGAAGSPLDAVLDRARPRSPLLVQAGFPSNLAFRVRSECSGASESAVETLLGALVSVAEGLVSGSAQCLGDVRLLRAEERDSVLRSWNRTGRDYPRDVCLHELVEAQVARSPAAVAIIDGDTQLTFGELEERANQLAHYLRGLGVERGVRVGILGERCAPVVVGFLAVLKAGGTYVPLDPEDPTERLGFLLEDAQIAVLVTQEKWLARLPETIERVACVDRDQARIAQESTAVPQSGAGPADLAYMIYTSGSTGRPKGALNRHEGICNRLLWMQDEYRLEAGERVLQKTPFSFDVSGWELFWPLISGATLVLARPGGHRDPTYLVDLIVRRGITRAHFVPSMLAVFLEDPNVSKCTSLRQVVVSGEELPFELQQRFFERLSADLDNLYGPTEAAIDVSHWRCDRAQERGPVPIGRAVANTRLYILDESLEPVPVGFAGELCIAGVQVGAGYHGRPELTASRFVRDPFAGSEPGLLYRTGDLARYREDGVIDFLGRIDNQVKVRGFRIEPGEIDAVIAALSEVRSVTTIARDFGGGDKRLVSYVVPEFGDGARLSDETTLAACRERAQRELPEHMRPSAWVVLEELPVTSNGKIDRRALPDPNFGSQPVGGPASGAKRRAGRRAAKNDLERYLIELWCEVLKLPDVAPDQPFFELGGSSLLAATCTRRVQERLGEQIFVVALFEAPTVAQFSQYLQGRYPEAVAREFPALAASVSPSGGVEPDQRRIDARDLDRLQALATPEPHTSPSIEVPSSRNPRAIFILSTHRSGTTLLRAMLAGHPGLFAASELQLLGYTTMKERADAFHGAASLWSEGAIRAVMEIEQCDAERARAQIDERESETTREFFGHLQSRIAPRTLVDKSPTHALDPVALRRAEAWFEDPFYIHLVRDPRAMVGSAQDFRMDQVWMMGDHGYSPSQLSELVWSLSHRNILDFLATVPPERQSRVRFEELVREPRSVMEALSLRMGLPFHPGLVTPYEETERKMLDGIHPESMPMGDTHFHDHGRIDPSVADKWLDSDVVLADVTWEIAQRLGYARASHAPEEHAPRSTGERPSRRRTNHLGEQRRGRRRHRGA